jgi:hypothetical protein
MNVLLPELRLLQPLAARVAQEPLSLFAHVEESEGRGVRAPEDGAGRIEDVTLLLGAAAPPALGALADGQVADHRDRDSVFVT